MCGISSLFHNLKSKEHSLEKLMFNAMWTGAVRGHHSTGLIYQAEDEVDHYKKAVPGYDFMHLPIVDEIYGNLHKTPYLICHNRAATRGEVKHSNAHPFHFDHITGVHNGTLSAYYDLTPNGVNHPVDSMHLYDAMSREGWATIAPEVRGSFNLLWHDANDDTIHLCKNTDRPYCFAKLKDKDVLIGMSEKAHLKWLIGRHSLKIEYCWTPENNVEYIWQVGEDMVKPADRVKHKAYVPPPAPPKQDNVTNLRNNTHSNQNHPKMEDKVSRIELTEFFLDSFELNKHPVAGATTYTAYGQTVEGEPVMILNCSLNEFEVETWYTGRGVWIQGNIPSSSHWRMYHDTVKLHPLENPDESLNVCVNCGDDHYDSQGVYIDNAPLCLSCCHSLNVGADRLDDPADAAKLITH